MTADAIPWTDVASTLAQLGGVAVAAVWAIIKLRRERPNRSRLTLTPTVDVRPDKTLDLTFVAVTTTVANVGVGVVTLADGTKPIIDIWAVSLLATDIQDRAMQATELELFRNWPFTAAREKQGRTELRSGQSVVFATVIEIPGYQVGVQARATLAYTGSKSESIVGECVSLLGIGGDQ